MTAAVTAVHAIDPITTPNTGGLVANRSHLATLRQQLAVARAAPGGQGDAARVEMLARRKAEVEARIETLRQDAAPAPRATPPEAGAAEVASPLGSNLDEFV